MTNNKQNNNQKDKHTKKNFPFLYEMEKDGWIITPNNKHILIGAYKLGYETALSEVEEIINKIEIDIYSKHEKELRLFEEGIKSIIKIKLKEMKEK